MTYKKPECNDPKCVDGFKKDVVRIIIPCQTCVVKYKPNYRMGAEKRYLIEECLGYGQVEWEEINKAINGEDNG